MTAHAIFSRTTESFSINHNLPFAKRPPAPNSVMSRPRASPGRSPAEPGFPARTLRISSSPSAIFATFGSTRNPSVVTRNPSVKSTNLSELATSADRDFPPTRMRFIIIPLISLVVSPSAGAGDDHTLNSFERTATAALQSANHADLEALYHTAGASPYQLDLSWESIVTNFRNHRDDSPDNSFEIHTLDDPTLNPKAVASLNEPKIMNGHRYAISPSNSLAPSRRLHGRNWQKPQRCLRDRNESPEPALPRSPARPADSLRPERGQPGRAAGKIQTRSLVSAFGLQPARPGLPALHSGRSP